MKKWFHRIFVAVFAIAFVTSGIVLGTYYMRYKNSRDTQKAAVAQYTRPSAAMQQKTGDAAEGQTPAAENQDNPADDAVYAPIEVDFAQLQNAGKDVIGWIYCEDTVINYPVVYGRDNEFYLNRNYMGEYDPSGSIFSDEENANGFSDANVLLYGHHMADKTMFAPLNDWMQQSYYETHPVMWLLTPEQDYRVELFAGYITSADSETYRVFHEPGPDLESYLNWARKWSEIQSEVETGAEGKYVVLSTCDYSFDEARSVLHGKLVPVDSAGGIPLEKAAAK